MHVTKAIYVVVSCASMFDGCDVFPRGRVDFSAKQDPKGNHPNEHGLQKTGIRSVDRSGLWFHGGCRVCFGGTTIRYGKDAAPGQSGIVSHCSNLRKEDPSRGRHSNILLRFSSRAFDSYDRKCRSFCLLQQMPRIGEEDRGCS